MQLIIDLGQHIWPFILVLLTIVFIHEFGHYAIAKLCRVKVDVFSIGFGPEICGYNDRSGTRWKLCWIPIGGYVKMLQDDIKQPPVTSELGSFYHKSLWQKAAIVIAGPLMNFLFAILVIALLLFSLGSHYSSSKIDQIVSGSVAEKNGVQAGDVITSINGSFVASFNDIERLVAPSYGKLLELSIDRGGEVINKKITPVLVEYLDNFGNKIKIGRLGIKSKSATKIEYSISAAVTESCIKTYQITAGTFIALTELIKNGRGSEDLSGAIGIAKYSSQAASGGLPTILMFMAFLSINLGLMNLLPIPVLDGGHLLFYLIEAIFGKRIASSCQPVAISIGITFLLSATIFTTINDLKKIIF